MIIIFLIGAINVVYSLIKPNIETFKGFYEGYSRSASALNPFQLEYRFVIDGDKKYVDTDIISMPFLFTSELKEGCLYEISYETNQNLILEVNPINE